MKDKGSKSRIRHRQPSNNDAHLIPKKRKTVGNADVDMKTFTSQCRSKKISASPVGCSGANTDHYRTPPLYKHHMVLVHPSSLVFDPCLRRVWPRFKRWLILKAIRARGCQLLQSLKLNAHSFLKAELTGTPLWLLHQATEHKPMSSEVSSIPDDSQNMASVSLMLALGVSHHLQLLSV